MTQGFCTGCGGKMVLKKEKVDSYDDETGEPKMYRSWYCERGNFFTTPFLHDFKYQWGNGCIYTQPVAR